MFRELREDCSLRGRSRNLLRGLWIRVWRTPLVMSVRMEAEGWSQAARDFVKSLARGVGRYLWPLST